MHLSSPFGIPVRVHASFGGLVVFFAGWGLVQAGMVGVLASLVAVAMLSVSVVLHELGHALAARRFGIATESITLYPFGGVAAIERMPEEPDQEMVIALAGPAVNFVLTAITGALWLATGFAPFGLMALMNAGMGAFNLIPAFPMDGGRVLRALLAQRMGFLPASRLSVRIGRTFAWGFVVVGLLKFWPSLALVGAFLLVALHQERERLVGMTWEKHTGQRPPWDPEASALRPFFRYPGPLR
jgi:Zn-dependent protease